MVGGGQESGVLYDPRLGADAINEAVVQWLADPEVNLGGRAQLLDENSLRETAGAAALGRVYFQGGAFHPTRLGIELGSRLYFDAVYAAAHLATKKVIVCDLDNTLWNGVIGEGAVTHHLDRQELLKELRRRGVLLSINSKNDPRNVHWSGARLETADFVAPQINWDSKALNIGRIRDELNLKVKDFVFLDDRPDELERVRIAFPEIHALDATRSDTWRFLGHWQRTLPSDPDEDRTRLYHERVRREQFVKDRGQAACQVEDEAAALTDLGLAVTIREAGRSELKRAVELINRTNQFNLCGSRTTLRELQDGLGTSHAVFTADASDKFGHMGVVGVMVAEWKPNRVEIPIFVLSCRVFGFGIEYALLYSLRQLTPPETGCDRPLQGDAVQPTLPPDVPAERPELGRPALGRADFRSAARPGLAGDSDPACRAAHGGAPSSLKLRFIGLTCFVLYKQCGSAATAAKARSSGSMRSASGCSCCALTERIHQLIQGDLEMWTWVRKSVGRWFSSDFWDRLVAHAALRHQFSTISSTTHLSSREQIWDQCSNQIGSDACVLLLEFGVWQGYSTRYLSTRFTNSGSRFWGFDSFEGLPEEWGSVGQGTFDVGGSVPNIPDSRIQFVKGWFQDTVDKGIRQAKESMGAESYIPIIHFDADLYSSTLFVLCRLHAHFDDYYFIFDEFTTHECRALLNYIQSHGAEATFIAHTGRDFPCQVFGKLANRKTS